KRVTSVSADEFGPSWSPDGSSIAFVSGTGIAGRSIESINLQSNTQHTLLSITPEAGRLEAPSFSPDGKKIAYIQFGGVGLFMNEAHLMVADVDGGKFSYTGKAIDTFPFPAVWLSKNELLYTGDGK